MLYLYIVSYFYAFIFYIYILIFLKYFLYFIGNNFTCKNGIDKFARKLLNLKSMAALYADMSNSRE